MEQVKNSIAPPKVSVILTSFNHEEYICEAIDSVLNQSFTDFELIIWDDASSDSSWQLIKQYSDPRIKSFRNDVQRRGAWGVNKAISEIALGEYIAIHHSDDVWLPDKLEKQVAVLQENDDYGAVFTDAQAVDECGEKIEDKSEFYYSVFDQANRSRYEWLNYFLTNGNCLCHPSVVIRKKCYEDCGLYRYGFAQLGDFDMWVRLCMRYEIHVSDSKLIKFRVSSNSGNTSADTMPARTRMFTEYYFIVKNYLRLTSVDELKAVFPGIDSYCSSEDPVPEYLLARAILDAGGFALSKVFALDILFGLLNDPEASVAVKKNHQFGPIEFVDLTSKVGMANKYVKDEEEDQLRTQSLLSELRMLKADRDALVSENRKLANEKDEMIRSLSWRITRPLRHMSRTIRWYARGTTKDT